jgi:ATP-binding cassette subfamily B protein
MAKASAAGDRVIQIFDTPHDVADQPGAVEAPPFRGGVEFDNVYFAYEPGHDVLKGTSVSIEPGQSVAIIGPSGAGKSTIIGLISRLYDPDRGRVLIDGRDLREYTLESLRAQISVVLQDTLLFATSIRENIAFGAPDSSDQDIEAAARLANAHDFIEALPAGYQTPVGERGVTLSAGQRQRIAVARAALRKAPILILDEPTTGLDPEARSLLIEALERLSRKQTTFMITHDMNDAAGADVIFRIEHGILKQVSPSDLLPAAGNR